MQDGGYQGSGAFREIVKITSMLSAGTFKEFAEFILVMPTEEDTANRQKR